MTRGFSYKIMKQSNSQPTSNKMQSTALHHAHIVCTVARKTRFFGKCKKRSNLTAKSAPPIQFSHVGCPFLPLFSAKFPTKDVAHFSPESRVFDGSFTNGAEQLAQIFLFVREAKREFWQIEQIVYFLEGVVNGAFPIARSPMDVS